MLSFRRFSAAALTAAIALGTVSMAQAGEFKAKYPSYPLVTNNSINANNVAAGFGNTANQSIFATQSGAQPWRGYMGGMTTNSLSASNLAAGEFNQANQRVMTTQR